MDYKELMCGDWVKVEQVTEVVNAKVLGVYKDGINYEVDYSGVRATNQIHTDYVSPIELTEDILVKNGFSEIHHPGTGATDEYSEWFFGGIKIIEWLEDWKYHYFSAGGDGAPIDFQYVHQLQHLLRLCGIEKELTI